LSAHSLSMRNWIEQPIAALLVLNLMLKGV